jgi:hypothetical protein
MPDSGLARLQSQEPALLTAAATFAGGFLAQAGPGHIAALSAVGTSATVSGLQGILTRANVFSPDAVRTATAVEQLTGNRAQLVDPNSPTPWLGHGAEPSLTMAVVGLFIGFLVQLVGGSTNLLQALGIAGGIALTQGFLTRQQVFSPKTLALAQLSPAGIAGLISPNSSKGFAGMLFKGAEVELSSLVPDALGPGGPTASAAAESARTTPRAKTTLASSLATLRLTTSPGVIAPEPSEQPGLISLLQRYRPEIRYDSLESYYADSAAVLTDHPGNLLKRSDGTVIAAADTSTTPGTPRLTLDFLARQYPGGQSAAATDCIQLAKGDFATQARQMHLTPGYGDRVHGRVAIDKSGARWLQYWLFMYYDDPGFLGLGTHQGDLEMIQLRLDANDQPDVASYSQHRSGLQATWAQLEHAATADGPVPVTYSARGSHANLLRSGIQISTRSFLPDHNNGQGDRVQPELIVLSDTQAPWSLWPGAWGASRATGPLGQIGITANSPAALPRHRAWNDPAGFHASCDVADDVPPAGQPTGAATPTPPPPQITSIQRNATTTTVHLTIPAHPGPTPTTVIAGLVSPDPTTPAVTASAHIVGTTATVEIPTPPGGGSWSVHATTSSEAGVPSETTVAAAPPRG